MHAKKDKFLLVESCNAMWDQQFGLFFCQKFLSMMARIDLITFSHAQMDTYISTEYVH